MATQNAANQKFTNNADGFALGGGTTQRDLTMTGSNATITGSGSNVHTFPTGSDTLVGRTSVDTLVSKTLTNPTISNFTEGVVVIGTVSTAVTLNLTNGTIQIATLTASTACTFTMPTATAGKSFTLMLKQADSTGGGTATFAGVKWSATGAPTMTSSPGYMDILHFIADGANWYGSYTQGIYARSYLRSIGTQEYANTFQTGTSGRDLTSDGWVDHSYLTGTYLVSSYNSTQIRLIPSGVGAYRSYNCYYYNTAMSNASVWGRVKLYRVPQSADTNGGGGIVLRHNGTSGIFCKVMTSGNWRIYTGTSNSTTSTDANILTSGTLPATLMAGDELTALVTSGNVVYFYLNSTLLGSVSTAFNSSSQYVGVLISQNDAAELYDFRCGNMASDSPP